MSDRENIRVADPNFTTDGDYFYSLHESSQTLQVKSDDGTTAFNYPCDTAITNTVNSLERDGVYFWSLEDKTGGGLIIRKWAIDSFLLKQQTAYTLTDGGGHTYSSSDMAIEHYELSVGDNNNGSGGYTYGLSEVKISDTSMLSPGDVLTFVKRRTLTQNRYSSSYIETAVVDSVASSTNVVLTGAMSGDPYSDGKGFRGPSATFSGDDPAPPDLVYVTKYIWLINDNAPNNPGTGALYKISASNGSNIVQYSGTQYNSIKGASFYTKYSTSGTHPYKYNTTIDSDQQYLLFVKGSSLLFYNVDSLNVDKSLALDNVKSDLVSVWDVHDIAIAGYEPYVSLYRLQLGTTYGSPESDENWSVYSYEKTLLARVVHSISVVASPTILPADGSSSSDLTAVVRDQYNNPVASKTVNWSDDSGESRVSPSSSLTDAFGRASATYTAGSTEDDVKITAAVANGLVS